MSEVLRDLNEIKITPDKKKSAGKIEAEAGKKPVKWYLEWPRAAAVVAVILAVFFLFYSFNLERTSGYHPAAPGAGKVEMSGTRQQYEGYIKQAEEAATRDDYSAALSYLEKAKKIAATPRVAKRVRELKARSQAQYIKTDAQQLMEFLNSPAPRGEKIKKCLEFLQTYNSISPFLQQDRDDEILAVIAQIQAYLEQLQVRAVMLEELPETIVNPYYERIRRIEIPGLPPAVRALGHVNVRFRVTVRGKVFVQRIDDTGLKVTGQNHVETVKGMIKKKLSNIYLVPPKDKSGAAVRIIDWDVTFKVGTFQDKIILLYEA